MRKTNAAGNGHLIELIAEVRGLQKELTDTKNSVDKIWTRIEALQQPKPTPWMMILGACTLLITISTGILAIWSKSEWGPINVQLQTVKQEMEKVEQDKRWIWDTTSARADHQDRLIAALYNRMLGQAPDPFIPKKTPTP